MLSRHLMTESFLLAHRCFRFESFFRHGLDMCWAMCWVYFRGVPVVLWGALDMFSRWSKAVLGMCWPCVGYVLGMAWHDMGMFWG